MRCYVTLPTDVDIFHTGYKTSSHQCTHWSTEVIILSYMRSGSTFLGELSQQNPGHLYWFEPMDGLYSSLYGTWPGWFPEDIAYYTNGTAR